MSVFICRIYIDVQIVRVLVENQGVPLQEAFLLHFLVFVKAVVDDERYRLEKYLKYSLETVVIVHRCVEVVEIGIVQRLALSLASHQLFEGVDFLLEHFPNEAHHDVEATLVL